MKTEAHLMGQVAREFVFREPVSAGGIDSAGHGGPAIANHRGRFRVIEEYRRAHVAARHRDRPTVTKCSRAKRFLADSDPRAKALEDDQTALGGFMDLLGDGNCHPR